MESKKQSSIEWFNQQLVDRQNGNGDSRSWDEIFEEAKEMHRIEIESAYWIGQINEPHPIEGSQCNKYYNETFKNQDNG